MGGIARKIVKGNPAVQLVLPMAETLGWLRDQKTYVCGGVIERGRTHPGQVALQLNCCRLTRDFWLSAP